MELDIHLNGAWRACCSISLSKDGQASRRGGLTLRYDADYALENLQAYDYRAVSVRMPVDLSVRHLPHWPAFLIDLLPQGAALQRLQRGLSAAPNDWTLLALGASNPVGNLRVRPQEARTRGHHPGFELEEMIARADGFIDSAHEAGAAVAGATDVAGDAPKFWVIETDEGRWLPDDGRFGAIARRHALLKFPLPEAGPRAVDILSHEAAYQRVARQFGLSVTPDLPEFIGGALLIPRFDRRRAAEGEIRLGVESLDSVVGLSGAGERTSSHDAALISMRRCVTDFAVDLLEYFRRDILNLALGNRANHGRNTAVVKDTDGAIRLAPLFDFGPSFLDARGIARTMRWHGERADHVDWNVILEDLAARFDEADLELGDLETLADNLRAFGEDLARLPDVMLDCGVDGRIVQQRQAQIETLSRTLARLEVP